MSTEPLPTHVSDHAVLRYLERVDGIDVAKVRQMIAAITKRGVDVGAQKIRCNGVSYYVRDGVITTVTRNPKKTKRARRMRPSDDS